MGTNESPSINLTSDATMLCIAEGIVLEGFKQHVLKIPRMCAGLNLRPSPSAGVVAGHVYLSQEVDK